MKTWRGGAVVEAGAEVILNNMGLKQHAYILNWVGRVTRCTLAGVVDGWVMSQWKMSWLLGDIRWAHHLVLLLVGVRKSIWFIR